MKRTGLVCCLLGVMVVLPHRSDAQTVRGQIIDRESGSPVPAVYVRVLDTKNREVTNTVSDSTGRFLVRWTGPDRVRITTVRIGYRPSTSDLFDIEDTHDFTVRLIVSTEAVPVNPLYVSARNRTYDISGNLAEIERRRKLGFGKVIMREQILAAGAAEISDVLRFVPGIQLRQRSDNPRDIEAWSTLGAASTLGPPARGSTSGTGGCPMMLFVDGRIHRYPIMGVNVFPTSDVQIIEVFRSLGEVPAEFAGDHASCGVIVIWTTRR